MSVGLSYEVIQSKGFKVNYEAIQSKGFKVNYEAIQSKGFKVNYEAIQQVAEVQQGEESQKNRFGDILNETMKTASASSPTGQALMSPYPIGVSCFDLSSLLT